jgi:LPS export ABC transporter protein LptC
MQRKCCSAFIYNILIGAMALCFYSCENNLDTVNLITAKDKTPLGSEENATIIYTDSAKTKFVLKAPIIEQFGGSNPYQIAQKGVTIDFYDDSTHANGHISANYAIRNERTGLMEGDNNVVVINKKGERLNTEQLFWDQNKHRIYTSKFVQIKTDTQILYGDGLESNEDFTDYRITNIRGSILLNVSTSTK